MVDRKHDSVDLVGAWAEGLVETLLVLLALLHLLPAPALLLLPPSLLVLLRWWLAPSIFADNFLPLPDVLLPRLRWVRLSPSLLILLSLLSPAHKICRLDIINAKWLI